MTSTSETNCSRTPNLRLDNALAVKRLVRTGDQSLFLSSLFLSSLFLSSLFLSSLFLSSLFLSSIFLSSFLSSASVLSLQFSMIRPAQHSHANFLPLLITGIAGVAGYNAFQYLRQRYPGQVVGVRRSDNWRLAGEGIVACDGHDRDGLTRLFDRHGFAAVLNAEGSCKLKSCELDPTMAWRVNVQSVETLLDVIGTESVRLVHLSVDLVFSGLQAGAYVETDPTDPVTIYGRTMSVAEAIIRQRQPDACILRISLPMGVSFNGHAGAIDWIQSRFKQSKPATLFYDEIRTPTYTDCLNRLFEGVLAGSCVAFTTREARGS